MIVNKEQAEITKMIVSIFELIVQEECWLKKNKTQIQKNSLRPKEKDFEIFEEDPNEENDEEEEIEENEEECNNL